MSELDFRKQLLLNEFKTLSQGKKNDEIIPLLFAINDKAKKSGITFTKEDCQLVINSTVSYTHLIWYSLLQQVYCHCPEHPY